MTNKKLREEIYRATDSFLVEAKDQNGNDRSLERLNKDRHLFVDRMIEVISQAVKEAVDETELSVTRRYASRFVPHSKDETEQCNCICHTIKIQKKGDPINSQIDCDFECEHCRPLQ